MNTVIVATVRQLIMGTAFETLITTAPPKRTPTGTAINKSNVLLPRTLELVAFVADGQRHKNWIEVRRSLNHRSLALVFQGDFSRFNNLN